MLPDDIEEPPSRLVRAAADAAVVVAGARLGGVGGAALAAAAGPYAEEFLRRALGEFRPDAQRRVTKMLGSASKASECDSEELADLISDSERTRLLTATAMASAASTAWPPKVYALGRALADGLIAADDAEVNIADLAIPAMTDMERPHLAVLELLVRWVPDQVMGQPLHLLAHQGFPAHNTRSHGFNAGDFTRSGWTIGKRKWTDYQIEEALPTVEPVLTSLIGTLQRHGLAQQFDDAPGLLAKFSEKMRQESSREVRAGQRITASSLLPPTISEWEALGITSPPRWSPTELGERVLGYYHLAGEFTPKGP